MPLIPPPSVQPFSRPPALLLQPPPPGPLKWGVLAPRSPLSPFPGSPSATPEPHPPHCGHAGKGKGILCVCFCFLFSLNQHRMDRGGARGRLSWCVTKGASPQSHSPSPGEFGRDQHSVSPNSWTQLLTFFPPFHALTSQGRFLLLGRWLAVVGSIRQGCRWSAGPSLPSAEVLCHRLSLLSPL